MHPTDSSSLTDRATIASKARGATYDTHYQHVRIAEQLRWQSVHDRIAVAASDLLARRFDITTHPDDWTIQGATPTTRTATAAVTVDGLQLTVRALNLTRNTLHPDLETIPGTPGDEYPAVRLRLTCTQGHQVAHLVTELADIGDALYGQEIGRLDRTCPDCTHAKQASADQAKVKSWMSQKRTA